MAIGKAGMDSVVAVSGLTKPYGDVVAVDNLSLHIRPGDIYGFLGLNGAGKTTTIRMLLGMVRPTSGTAKIFDQKVHATSQDIWSRVGYLVDVPSAYPDLTVRENLEVTRRLYHIADPRAVDRIMEVLALGSYANRCARTLSHGNAQRLGLAKAIIHDPELLLLDEPASGLDPAGIVEVREMLLALARERGTTVFMSSHLLDEVARLATRIGIIHEGRLLEELDTAQLERHLRPRLLIDARDREAARMTLVGAGSSVKAGEDGTLEVDRDRAIERPDEVSSLLVKAGVPPTLLHVKQESLEAHFLRMVGAHRGGRP